MKKFLSYSSLIILGFGFFYCCWHLGRAFGRHEAKIYDQAVYNEADCLSVPSCVIMTDCGKEVLPDDGIVWYVPTDKMGIAN